MADRFVAKDKLTANHLNQLVDACNLGLPILGGEGVETFSEIGRGTTVNLSIEEQYLFNVIIGKITNTGPNSEADFSDYRYWVQIQRNHNTSDKNAQKDELTIEDKDTSDPENNIIAAFNVAEYLSGSHQLALNDLVIVLPVRFDYGNDAYPQTRFLIVKGGTESTGEFQWQGRFMVTSQQAGWEFPRLHGLLNNS